MGDTTDDNSKGLTETMSTHGMTNTSEDELFNDCFPFLELPPELVLKVCDYLDSATVINVLSKVCEFLALLAADELIWKTRIHKRWPAKRYPPVAAAESFDWKLACIARETEYRKWKDPAKYMTRTDISFGVCVDAVHITQNGCLLLGLRDHTLFNFKISDIPFPDGTAPESSDSLDTPNEINVNTIRNRATFEAIAAHKGWIWTIRSDEDKLCSGGWDSKVALWEYSGRNTASYRCGSAVLCSTMQGNEVLAGTFNKNLVKIDTRCEKPVSTTQIHTKAVLCMERTANWIITGSESKIIHIIDNKSLKICNTAKLSSGYPRSMSLQGNLLYVGSNRGAIHLYSFNEQLGSLTFLETFDGGHEKEIRSVKQTLGSIITASKDGVCKAWEPSGTPALMNQLQVTQSGNEICSMDYYAGILALGTGTGSVSLFREKSATTEYSLDNLTI